MAKSTSGQVKASDSAVVTKSKETESKTTSVEPKIAPTTNGVDKTAKPSSTLPKGKSLNEVAQADAPKQSSKKESQVVGETVYSKTK